MSRYCIGMDIGGTNTDAVLIDENTTIQAAVKTNTTADIATGFKKALQRLLEYAQPESIERILLGTTHATNALLQNQGLYRVGVIRIAGHKPESLPPCFAWPEGLRNSVLAGCITVDGGYECHGTSITPLNILQAKEAILKLVENGAESLAIVGVFSPLNGEQENTVAQAARDLLGQDFPVSVSHRVGGMGFIERENTTILNAALKKVMAQGFRQLETACRSLGLQCPLYITQNNGSIITLDDAVEYPVLTISAGPTNSFIGGVKMARVLDAIVVDVGGTSTDVGLVRNGFPKRSLNTSSIGGVRLNFSMPDVLSIALGGGSYVSLEHPNLQIGPLSAGREIITQALSFGGSRMTLTDAAVALGHVTIGRMQSPIPVADAKRVIEEAARRIQKEVAIMEGDLKEMPVLLVGGGAALFPQDIMGGRYQVPENAGVANAYGAALAEVAGVVDVVVSLNERERVLEGLQEEALEAAMKRGASKSSVRVVDVQIIPYHYVPNNLARVCVFAAGAFE